MARERDQAAEGGQEQLVESYLQENPGSTIPQIRDGIEAESGIKIERVQARIASISKRRQIRKGTGDYGRTTYALGPARKIVKAMGIEARILVEDGEVKLDVKVQRSDLDDPALAELVTKIKASLTRCMEGLAVPLVTRIAERDGLMQDPDADWLSELAALSHEEG